MSKIAHPYGQFTTPHEYNKNSTDKRGISSAVGVFVAVVKDNYDPLHFGRLEVFIPEFGGDPRDKVNWITVSYASPFAGSTSIFEQGENVTEYEDTIKSYGFWGVPPDLDTRVLVTFASGRIELGYWFACLYQRGTQISVPGLPAKRTYDGTPKPVAPKNKKDKNPDLQLYVLHKPLYNALVKQGLDRDKLRGLTSTSAERESPSHVIGFLSPQQQQVYIDDGDKGGQNRQIRLRTRNGAQVLLDDTTGHVYVISRDGDNWMELNNDGQIFVYGKNDISIRSEANINIRADKNINMEAGLGVNIKAVENNVTLEAGTNIATWAGVNTTITSMEVSHINSGVAHIETAPQIHMNGPVADQTEQIFIHQLVVNDGIKESINPVVPEHEPWRGHSVIAITEALSQAERDAAKNPKKEEEPEEEEDESYPPSCVANRPTSKEKYEWYMKWRKGMQENLKRYKRGEISEEEFKIEEARMTEEMVEVMKQRVDYNPVENNGQIGYGTEPTQSNQAGSNSSGGNSAGGATGNNSLILNRPINPGSAPATNVGSFNANEFERITREKESGNGRQLRTNLSNASTIGGYYGMSDAARESAWRSMSYTERDAIGYPNRPPTLDDLVTADGKSHTSEQAVRADEALFRQSTKTLVSSNQDAVSKAWGNPNHKYSMADARGTWWHGPAGYPALVEAARTNPNQTVSDFYKSNPQWRYPDMRQFGGTQTETNRTVAQQLAVIQTNVGGRG